MSRKGCGTFAGLFLVLFCAAPALFAQTVPKIAAIDLQRTLEESVEGKNVISRLRLKEQGILGELDKIDKQILSLETKLKAQRLTLTEEAQGSLALDLDRTRIMRKRIEEDSAKDFQRLQMTLLAKMQDEVFSLIKDYAGENQIHLVFSLSPRNGLVYFQPGLDITAEIIKRYDALKSATGAPALR
jgi:Skp family chaperone for outer membrane proteins